MKSVPVLNQYSLLLISLACPNICLQMLVRGSNAVGYTSYPDNVVAEFIRLAAKNGMDIFRIFDCFNDVDSMKVSLQPSLLTSVGQH